MINFLILISEYFFETAYTEVVDRAREFYKCNEVKNFSLLVKNKSCKYDRHLKQLRRGVWGGVSPFNNEKLSHTFPFTESFLNVNVCA